MGHKVNPLALRMGFIRTWHSRWFAQDKDYANFINEDYQMRKMINKRFKLAAVSKIIIERMGQKIKVTIYSAKPGIIIGRHGGDIERLREDINKLVKQEVAIDVKEVNNPTIDAQIVALNDSFCIQSGQYISQSSHGSMSM